MKFIYIFSFILLACAHKTDAPLSASDSMAGGSIFASASKILEGQDLCFDITLSMKGVSQKEISTSNWTAAWVDKDSRYHLLVLNQRVPASVPEGGPHDWISSFKTCAPFVRTGPEGYLILTPRSVPYSSNEGLKFKWK